MKEFKKTNQKMSKRTKNSEKMIDKLKASRLQLLIAAAAFNLWFNGFYCLAGANYGEDAGNWVLNQLFWFGLVAVAAILISCILKRAWIAAIITVVAGAVILAFIKNPLILSNIGQNIVDTVFK